MITRIITAIVALAVFVGVLIAPPVVFTLALAAVILVMLWECYTATKADTATRVVGFISAILIMCVAGFGGFVDFELMLAYLIPPVVVTILLYMILVVFKHGKKSYKEILSNGLLTLYVVLSMGCIWFTRQLYGTSVMLLIFVCAWSTDTFAYFTGSLFGKHKLIPHVSPKKTVEGAIGGVIGAALISVLYVFVVNDILKIDTSSSFLVDVDTNLTYPIAITLGILGGILSQFGDLAASAIKRDAGIKDFGWIFPGHGGLMDRFDSVMYIAPIFYLVNAKFFMVLLVFLAGGI